MTRLRVKKPKADKPIIVAMIGLVGSGKSSVAREFAKCIRATVVKSDEIRVRLRRQSRGYGESQKIAENLALEVIKRGGNVVLDSDFVDPKKRASIEKSARRIGAGLVFVRTHCDLDVAIGRILTATYHNHPDDFFGSAPSKWRGSAQSKGAVVKLREMWRRTPHHYSWMNTSGGKWILKKLSFEVLGEIDTTDPDQWKRQVKLCVKKIVSL